MRGNKRRVLISTAIVGLMTFLVGGGIVGLSQTNASSPNSNVQIVNLSDQSFSVAWQTASNSTGGSIIYGTDSTCGSLPNTANELPSNGFVHLAESAGGLSPNTTYHYEIVDGTGGNDGVCRSAKTYATQSVPPAPCTVYGTVTESSSPLTGSLVEVELKHGATTSQPLATIADTTGGTYALPFCDLTDATGAYIVPASGDSIQVEAIKSPGTYQSETVSYDGTSQLVEQSIAVMPTAAPVRWFRASRHHGSVFFAWKMAEQQGVVGFNAYAGGRRVNHRLITVHRSRTYQYVFHYRGDGKYRLGVMQSDGHQETVRPTR